MSVLLGCSCRDFADEIKSSVATIGLTKQLGFARLRFVDPTSSGYEPKCEVLGPSLVPLWRTNPWQTWQHPLQGNWRTLPVFSAFNRFNVMYSAMQEAKNVRYVYTCLQP